MAHHFSVIVAQSLGAVVGLATATLVGVRIARTISLRFLLALCLILLLPGLALAVAEALFAPAVSPGVIGIVQGLFVAPLCGVPVLVKVSGLTPGLARAGRGLGAGRAERLRLIWFPLFAPSLLASLCVTAVVLVVCIAVRGS